VSSAPLPSDSTASRFAPRDPAFRDPRLEFRNRADDLLSRLTEAEKIAMLHQQSPAVPRLGIAPFATGQEALHGAAWRGPATVFPQAVGLGAAWDPELVRQVGEATAREVRALHDKDQAVSLNLWAPVVNLLRDPRWGRNEEGYSEDPLLTARTAIAFCHGLIGRKGDYPGYLRTAPTLKHFLAYNNETDRTTTSSVLRPRVLNEYDLPPFREPIEQGAAAGIMPAYNLVNGRPCHVSPYLDLARQWTNEELLFCSDAFAPSNLVNDEHYFDDHPTSHAAALKAGLDSFTDQDGDGKFTGTQITEALNRGLITMQDIDRAVRRKLLIRLRLGEFDPGGGPHVKDGIGTLNCDAHKELARQAARQVIVLLKNDGALLPLAFRQTAKVAVVGPFADTLREDWYSGTMPYKITVADGMRDALKAHHGEVTTADGADRVTIGPGLGEFDVFDWGGGVVTLRAAASGRYLTVKQDGSLAADQERPNGWVVGETFVREPATATPEAGPEAGPEEILETGAAVLLRSTANSCYLAVDPESGQLTASAPDAASAQSLTWHVTTDGSQQAAARARAADIAIVVVGNDPLIHGRETQDRTTIALPPSQESLVRAVHAANPKTILVIMSSYPYATTWADEHVPAIIWTAHGGQEAGRALADVLLGSHPPTGRLAQTWYRSDDDLPGIGDYDIIKSKRTYLYFDGAPLYPFGHGLTYTTFAYQELKLSSAEAAAEDTLTATVRITNTGSTEATEVIQLYARARGAWPERPQRQLLGFTRLTLAPGQTAAAEIRLPVAALATWDVETHRMTVSPGAYDILVGASSADIRQATQLTVRGPAPAPRQLLGTDTQAADFDDHEGITIVDATRESGDAVTPADPTTPGWILFRNTDFSSASPGATPGTPGQDQNHDSERIVVLALRIARAEPGEAHIEVWHCPQGSNGPGGGRLLARIAAPRTGGKYVWTEVSTRLKPATDIADLYLVLTGSLRLASFRIQ
jgi:beta-glucosidase